MNILTDEEMKQIHADTFGKGVQSFARAIEAAVLKKLAEQDVEPVHQWRKVAGDGRWRDAPKIEAFERVDAYYEARTLYTETQLLAAQQKAAEACAKVCANETDEQGIDSDAWYAAKNCRDQIRNGEWRKYL